MFDLIFEDWLYSIFLPLLTICIIPLLKGRYIWVVIAILSNIVAFYAALEGVRIQGLGGLPLAVLSFRLARPNSYWFTKFYKEDKKKLSKERFLNNNLQENQNLKVDVRNEIQKEIDILNQKEIEKNQIEELNDKRKQAGLIPYDEYLLLEEKINNLSSKLNKKLENRKIIIEGRQNETRNATYISVLIFVISFFQGSLLTGIVVFFILGLSNFYYWRNRFKRTDHILYRNEKKCENLSNEIDELRIYRDKNSVK